MGGYITISDSRYRQMFKDTMKELFLIYKSKHNGDTITVEKMIMGDRDSSISKQIDLLSYFLYCFQKDRRLSDIKLKEFTDFIRAERNLLFPNNYSNKPGKFIRNREYNKSSTIYDYVNNYIINITKTVSWKSLWK